MLQGDWSSDVCSSDLPSAMPITKTSMSASTLRTSVLGSASSTMSSTGRLCENECPKSPCAKDESQQIGRASCRERVERTGATGGSEEEKNEGYATWDD